MYRPTSTMYLIIKEIDNIENEIAFERYCKQKVKEQRHGKQFVPKCQYNKQPKQFRHSTMKV